ncbi:S4 domain-containing protein YaaA [Granulicatella seriolae]|uniref:S4 domain-containing protein YaaA n=1 Tax=Granulicatella seriolae TaxID=2967226 RepID=A0ABT1WS84_9LACT|nr:S4 domain-containing protein YaaA [Granulicatella seriolae]
MKEIIQIEEEYITLGKFLKHVDLISTGGQAKWFLQEYVVYVDDELENRRGKKLYHGSRIEVPGQGNYIVQSLAGKESDPASEPDSKKANDSSS